MRVSLVIAPLRMILTIILGRQYLIRAYKDIEGAITHAWVGYRGLNELNGSEITLTFTQNCIFSV